MTITRRTMLAELGMIGGGGLSFAAAQMLSMGSPAAARPPAIALPRGSGAGKRVAVIGAGIAGLVSALELSRAGYAVTVLEARERIGGRVWTLRGGDRVDQVDRPAQRVAFSPGLYMNAGAARLPHWHHRILGYARELGVRLEPFVNQNRAAGWDFGGQVHQERRMVYDLRGRIGEMVTAALDKGSLDLPLSAAETKQFRGFLGFLHFLDDKGRYQGSPAAGFRQWPGGYDRPGVPNAPLTLKELLATPGIGFPYFFESIPDMQASMLQPVGGMDRIAAALFAAVRPMVRLGTPVTAIRRDGAGVRIEHGAQATRADFAVVTIPAHLLARIPSDFSPAKRAALQGIPYLKSAKVGFEAPRFWEAEGIYGGNAWTDRLNENVMYPSSGYGDARGVLIGAYVAGWNHPDTPEAFVAKPIAEQIAIARASVEALHPGKSRLLEKPVAINWGQVRWSEGVGAVGDEFGETQRGARFKELLRPEGPVLFAGEHLSYMGLWQEGAAASAHEAVALLHQMATGAARAG